MTDKNFTVMIQNFFFTFFNFFLLIMYRTVKSLKWLGSVSKLLQICGSRSKYKVFGSTELVVFILWRF